MPTRKELIEQVRADQRARSARTRGDNPKSAIVGIGDRDPKTGLFAVKTGDGVDGVGEKQFNSSLPNGNQVLGIPQPTGGWLLDERDVQPIKPTRSPETIGKVKVLFSVIKGNERVFYVGGDRATPKKIYTIPVAAVQVTATLNNAGDGDRYFVGLSWADQGVQIYKVGVSNQKTWQVVTSFENLGGSLDYYGFDFWSQVPLDEPKSYFQGASILSLRWVGFNSYWLYSRFENLDSFDVEQGGNGQEIPYFHVVKHVNTKSVGISAYGASLFAMSGSLAYSSTGFSGVENALESHTRIATNTGGGGFAAQTKSIYKGVTTATAGTTISEQTSSTATVQSYAWYTPPPSITGSASSERNEVILVRVAPGIIKESTAVATMFGSITRVDSPYGFPSTYGTNHTESKDSRIPILTGNQGQSLYQHTGISLEYPEILGSTYNENNPLQTRSLFRDYYLATSQSEIKLGGELPKKASEPTIVEFRVSDNLIKSKCYRVQLDSSIFGKPTKPDIDVHSLSASSTKKTIKARMYGIPKPSSGMPTDAAGLAALTSQLKGGLPVTIGNVTIYNASYHP